MAFDTVSVLSGFLVGVATSAAGIYFANKYTDRRREEESARQAKKRFLAVKAQMPRLIEEMQNNLAGEGDAHIREFFILPNMQVCCVSRKDRFVYFEDQHENLGGKLDILVNNGYLSDATKKGTPTYRMTEEFVALLVKD